MDDCNNRVVLFEEWCNEEFIKSRSWNSEGAVLSYSIE